MKREVRIAAIVLLLLVPGCFGPGPFEDPEHVHRVCSSTVTEVPDDATVVDASDRRIRSVEPVQLAIEQARNDPGSSDCVTVNESQYANVSEQLQKMPLYDGDPHEEWGSSDTGLYVTENGTTLRVEISRSVLG